MKKCNSCKSDIGHDAIICPNCGQKIMSDGTKYIVGALFFLGLILVLEDWLF